MSKIFRFFPGEKCPVCFSSVEILSDFDVPVGMAFGGETVMCTKCSTVGVFDGEKIIWNNNFKVDRSMIIQGEIISLFAAILTVLIVAYITF